MRWKFGPAQRVCSNFRGRSVGNGAQLSVMKAESMLRAGVNQNGKGMHAQRHGTALPASATGNVAFCV